jgi:hypothetical protein
VTTTEDRLAHAAGALRRDVHQSVEVDAALARAIDPARELAPSHHDRHRRPSGSLLAAAAVLVVIVFVGALLQGDDEEPVVAGRRPSSATSQPGPPPTASEVPFRLLGAVPNSPQRSGSIAYAGVADALTDQWMNVTSDRVPEVDFDEQVVLVLTVAHHAGCPLDLAGLDRTDDGLRVGLTLGQPERDECGPGAESRTFFVAIDRAELPSRFSVELPAALDGSHPGVRADFDLSTNAGSHTPPSTEGEPPDAGLPDLQAPEPGREITFEGVGDTRLGQVLDPSEVTQYEGGGSCGYWGPQEPSHDGDEPPGGLVSGADGPSPRIRTIMVWTNLRYRTASGVGIGTTLATLERIYGDQLVVDDPDAEFTPTDGLVAYYQRVAAVRNGDSALTFYLHEDAVRAVKLSPAEFWGDDEGCA